MNFNNDVGIEHDKNFEDDNELKSLLKQYLIGSSEIRDIVFIKILKELSLILNEDLHENNLNIIIDFPFVIKLKINISHNYNRLSLIKLMLNGLSSITPCYINDNQDLGSILIFNITGIQ